MCVLSQSKDMKRFKDNLKEEEKLAIKRVELSAPKPERKTAVNKTKLDLQSKRGAKVMCVCVSYPASSYSARLCVQETAFFRKQGEDLENEVKQVLKEQKDERKALELSFLDAKHDLRRSECVAVSYDVLCVSGCCVADNTSLLWEMEQRQKQDHHQLLKQQLREAFHMQRHQMHLRHQRVRYCDVM